MLKIIALLVIIFVFFRAVGMVFRLLLGSGNVQQRGQQYSNQRQYHKKRKDDINVDHDPNKSNKGYQGGEYVDYEEVD